MDDLVSIITPNYNSERFLENTISSVLAQTYQHWEMIIVDDASTDNSRFILEGFASKDSRIKLLFNQTNKGPAESRNRAITAAKGKYIAFLDSDDLWMPEFLEKILAFVKEKNALFAFSSHRIFYFEKSLFLKDFRVPSIVDYDQLLKGNSIGCLTAVYDSSKLGKMLFKSNSPKAREDYVLWLEILKKVDFAYGLNELLAIYNVRDHAGSRNKLAMAKEQWKVYRHIEGLSLFSSLYYFTAYALNGLNKYREVILDSFLGWIGTSIKKNKV